VFDTSSVLIQIDSMLLSASFIHFITLACLETVAKRGSSPAKAVVTGTVANLAFLKPNFEILAFLNSFGFF